MASIERLANEERLATGATHKIKLSFTDIKSETSGTAFEIFPKITENPTFPKGTRILACAVRVPTLFVAASMTACALVIGDGGDDDRFLASSSIGGTGSSATAGDWYGHPQTTCPFTYKDADTVDAKVTATGAALSALTAGELEIYLTVQELNKIQG
jgi:hypothetical protein